MSENKDLRNENITKDQFSFVQDEKRIFDKKFETKPIGYFKDAMTRFAKNRGNVVASIILGIIILLSIFVPVFSTKNAETLETEVNYLPPRLPLLEDIGIADGYKYLENQPVDMDTIGTLEGLDESIGLPADIEQQYIDLDTLENYWTQCSDMDELCIGGNSVLRVDPGSTQVAIQTEAFFFEAVKESSIEINVVKIEGEPGTALNLLVRESFGGDFVVVGTITEPGLYTINPFDTLSVPTSWTEVRVEYVSPDNSGLVEISNLKVIDNTDDSPLLDLEGFDLSSLPMVLLELGEEDDPATQYKGNLSRTGAERYVASFEYDAYAKAFGPKRKEVFYKKEFDEIMVEYSDVCVLPDESLGESIIGWEFGEGCPIIKVNGTTQVVEVDVNNDGIISDDERFFDYDVTYNYERYKGYDSIPYYLLGTTAEGKDLFKMIWIGARTSLLLGVIVSFINISVGIVFGAISGYYGGTVDLIMQRFSEIMGRIPWLVTLSIFTALIGPGQTTLILVLIINGWIGIASITRTQFYRYKGREYVLASRTLGAKDGRLIFRHILPNGIGTIITSSILSIPAVIFTESTLSYLGFGIGHGQVLNLFGMELTGTSIGVLLNDGRNELGTNPHLTLGPAIVVSILMITFNMFGNALRDAFNPALRGSE